MLVPFHFADMLIAESALSFLGIGAPLGAATWGNMLQESRSYLIECAVAHARARRARS